MNRITFISLACLFFGSCGKNLTVNLAETAILWRVDDYFDIRQDQRKVIKANFRDALRSADQESIPFFEKTILSEEFIKKDCSEIEKIYFQLKPKIEEMRTSFLKQSYSFIDSIDQQQVKYFIRHANEEMANDEKKSKSDRVAQLEKKLKRTQSIIQELFGELSAHQEQSLQDHVMRQKDNNELLVQSRKKILSLLQNKTETEAKKFMKDYVIQWRDYQTPELNSAILEREVLNEKYYLKFFCQSSEKQKKHFQVTVADYLKLIRKVYIATKQ